MIRVSNSSVGALTLSFYCDRVAEIWIVNDLETAIEYLNDANVESELQEHDLTKENIFECIANNSQFRERLMRSNGYNADNILLNKMYPTVCPEHGEFMAYKALRSPIVHDDYMKTPIVIARLMVPTYAKRSSAFGRKCRASDAWVKSICAYDYETLEDLGYVRYAGSFHDSDFIYRPEKTVRPAEKGGFDEFRWAECSTGIHFFMTFEEALEFGKGQALM